MEEAAKKRKKIINIILISLSVLLVLLCIGLGLMLVIVSRFSRDLPDVRKLTKFEPSESSHIYARDGSLIGVLYKENRTWVDVRDIPQKMKEAIIATEDARFYKHSGIDLKGIARALFQNVKGGDISQGASTITQQLARNIFLGQERSFKRKIQEILLSMEIEKKLSKEQILEYYLNQIYFGSNAYGIQAASETYFGKSAKDLTIPECAIIAGLPAAPSLYSPFVNEKAALDRQRIVLQRMAVCGFITAEEEKKAVETRLSFVPKKTEVQMIKHPYFTNFALHELLQRYDENYLYRGGLKIYTTLDIGYQNAAEKALAEGLEEARKKGMNASNAALAAVDPDSGYIKAMIGGREFTEKNQFNRAWQARRPPGSSFKVFVYSMAMEQGYTPDSLVDDSPATYTMLDAPAWSPKNSDGSYMGTLTFRDSLKWSRNVCAVRVLNSVGVKEVAELAKKMGINDALTYNLPMALGSSEVTVLDMASAYGVIAAGGMRCKPSAIRLIKDSHGKIIEDNRMPGKEEVLSHAAAYAMIEMLQEVVQSGTGTAAQIGRPAGGKTGTTDEHRDAWFVGFVPQLSCAVWTGNDDNTQMNHVFGGTLNASIWARFMRRALAGEKIRQFCIDKKGRIGVMMCSQTGLRATGKCTETKMAFYAPGNVPRKFCAVHGLQRLQGPRRPTVPSSPAVRTSSPSGTKSPGGAKKSPSPSDSPGYFNGTEPEHGVPTLDDGSGERGTPPATPDSTINEPDETATPAATDGETPGSHEF